MNDMQIRCFLTTAECRSVSRAAELLYLAQPSVSRYLGQLEQELDVKLFTRQKRSMVLTDAGEAYFQFFYRTWKNFQDLHLHLRADREQAKTLLRYSVFPVWDIAPLLQKFEADLTPAHPHWAVRMEILPAEEMLRALLSGTVDLILNAEQLLHGMDQIVCLPLLNLPQVILYSGQSTLAGKSTLTPADFRDRPFLFLPDAVLTEDMIRRQLRSLEKHWGFSPAYRLVESADALYISLEMDQGVALMDSWSRYRTSQHLRSFDTNLSLPVALAWRKDTLNPAVPDFARETATWFRQHAEVSRQVF